MAHGRRVRPPPLNLNELPGVDIGNTNNLNARTPSAITPLPRAAQPAMPEHSPMRSTAMQETASDDSLEADIRFRPASLSFSAGEGQPRSLYATQPNVPAYVVPPLQIAQHQSQQATFGVADSGFTAQGTRKQSMVRPEDYLPQAAHAENTAFNPYQSPSWAMKPEGLELDLASPYSSPQIQEITTMSPMVFQANTSTEALSSNAAPFAGSPIVQQIAEFLSNDKSNKSEKMAKKERMLGGKKLVKPGEWRKKLQLDPSNKTPITGSVDSAHTIIEKDLNEKHASYIPSASDVHLGRLPEPDTVLVSSSSSPFQKALIKMSPVLLIALQAANLAYLAVRLWYLILAHEVTKRNNQTYVRAGAWIFWAIEALYFWRFFLVSLKATFTHDRKETKKLRIKGDAFLPTVDVLILCSGQHDQIVMDTAMAAARLDWPIDRIRILVVDDTGSHELQRRVESYASHRALHLSYHRRTSKTASPGKAALINFGLTETRMQGRLPGEYCLVLEADCLPEMDILRAMLPHMLQNTKLGLVRADQGFYNIPQKVNASFATLLACTEPRKDTHSGFVMRRSAVDDVGGFPVESSVEDGQLAALLLGKGYEVKFLREVLQYGMIQESWSTQMQQRLYRTLGPYRTAKRLRFFLSGSRIQKMRLVQKVKFLQAAFVPLLSLEVFACYVAFSAALLSGGFLLPALNMEQLRNLIRLTFACNILERLYEISFCYTTGHPTHFKLQQRWNFMSSYQIGALLKAAIPNLQPTSVNWKRETGTKERDAKMRTSFVQRFVSVFFTTGNVLHLLVFLLALFAVATSFADIIYPALHAQDRSPKQTFFFLLLSVLWPTMRWPTDLLTAWVATAYAVSPPTVQSRDYLLHREPITRIAKPAPDHCTRRPFKQTQTLELVCTTLTTIYATVLFVFSFFSFFVI